MEQTTEAGTTTETTAAPAGQTAQATQAESVGFLDSTQQAATTPAQADPTAPTEQLIDGKYKSVDDVLKAQKAAQSELQKLKATPDSYEISADLAELGITWQSDDQKAAVSGALKEAGLRQDQFEKLMPFYVAQVQAEVGKLMHVVDATTEQASLKQQWGSSYEANMKEIGDFAKTLPRELVFTPLQHSAAGMKLLHQLMMEKRGPELINSNDSGTMTATSAAAQMQELVANPDYWTNTPKGESLRAQHNALAARFPKN